MHKICGLFLGLTTLLLACSKDEGPKAVVEITAPQDSLTILVGNGFAVSAELVNGARIDQYKVELKIQAPGEVLDSAAGGVLFDPKNILIVSNPNQNAAAVNENISISNSFLPGRFALIVSIISENFNQGADTLFVRIQNLNDTVAPALNLVTPNPGTLYTNGDTVRVKLAIDEKRTNGTAGVKRRVKLMFVGTTSTDIYNTTYNATDTVNYNYVLPANTAAGSYAIKALVLDDYNNYNVISIPIVVN